MTQYARRFDPRAPFEARDSRQKHRGTGFAGPLVLPPAGGGGTAATGGASLPHQLIELLGLEALFEGRIARHAIGARAIGLQGLDGLPQQGNLMLL